MYIEKLYFVAEDCTALVTTTEQPAGTTTNSSALVSTTEQPTTTTSNSSGTTEGNTTKTPETTTTNNHSTTESPITKMTTMPPEPPTPKPGSPVTNTYTARNSTSDAVCLKITAGIEFVIPYVARAGVSR